MPGPTTRIVFAVDHSIDVGERIQAVHDGLQEAESQGAYMSLLTGGRRVDINPHAVRFIEIVGDPADHGPR